MRCKLVHISINISLQDINRTIIVFTSNIFHKLTLALYRKPSISSILKLNGWKTLSTSPVKDNIIISMNCGKLHKSYQKWWTICCGVTGEIQCHLVLSTRQHHGFVSGPKWGCLSATISHHQHGKSFYPTPETKTVDMMENDVEFMRTDKPQSWNKNIYFFWDLIKYITLKNISYIVQRCIVC